jgi:hypothetical protein
MMGKKFEEALEWVTDPGRLGDMHMVALEFRIGKAASIPESDLPVGYASRRRVKLWMEDRILDIAAEITQERIRGRYPDGWHDQVH